MKFIVWIIAATAAILTMLVFGGVYCGIAAVHGRLIAAGVLVVVIAFVWKEIRDDPKLKTTLKPIVWVTAMIVAIVAFCVGMAAWEDHMQESRPIEDRIYDVTRKLEKVNAKAYFYMLKNDGDAAQVYVDQGQELAAKLEALNRERDKNNAAEIAATAKQELERENAIEKRERDKNDAAAIAAVEPRAPMTPPISPSVPIAETEVSPGMKEEEALGLTGRCNVIQVGAKTILLTKKQRITIVEGRVVEVVAVPTCIYATATQGD